MSILKNKYTNTETVFMNKEQKSEQEIRIQALQKLINDNPDNNELKEELRNCEKGKKGEDEIEFQLKYANIGMYVIRDINMKYQDLQAQIDYIFITSAKIYFVECKNLYGNITVDSKGNFIKEYKYRNYGIKNPITQAQRHIKVFQEIWKERNTKFFDKILTLKHFDEWTAPLVVMANEGCVIDDSKAPDDVKKIIVKADRLVEYLKKDIENEKGYLYTDDDMKGLAEGIMNNYNIDNQKDYEKEYIEKFNLKTNDNEIKDNLLEFRTNKSKERNIPEDYIFTNEELDKLMEILPKTMDELKNSNILSDVKLKFHGEEIINIINK